MSSDKELFFRTAKNCFRLRTPQDGPYLPPVVLDEEDCEDEEVCESLITYYGQMWPRCDSICRAKMLNGMLDRAELVPLSSERNGIYFLFSDSELVYVGRITKRPLAIRLDEHTKDNLSHRWNKFSFFLFNEAVLDACTITTGIEAIMLEILAPKCNRTTGQQIAGTELTPGYI